MLVIGGRYDACNGQFTYVLSGMHSEALGGVVKDEVVSDHDVNFVFQSRLKGLTGHYTLSQNTCTL